MRNFETAPSDIDPAQDAQAVLDSILERCEIKPIAFDTDLVKLFKQEAGRFPLLKAEEEVALAKIIENGKEAEDDLDILSTGGTNDPFQLQHLSRCIEQGDTAKKLFVSCNLRWVINIGLRSEDNVGVENIDNIQNGTIGLIRAVEKYDWRQGFRFSTYATYWIKQKIARGHQEHGRAIRIPSYLLEVEAGQRRFARHLLSNPFLKDSHKTNDDALPLPRVALSLDQPVKGDESDATLKDFIPSEDSPTETAAIESNTKSTINNALETVKISRHREALILNFGLDGNEPMSKKDIGVKYGVSHVAVANWINTALGQMSQDKGILAIKDTRE